jgi:hypothetical protein
VTGALLDQAVAVMVSNAAVSRATGRIELRVLIPRAARDPEWKQIFFINTQVTWFRQLTCEKFSLKNPGHEYDE